MWFDPIYFVFLAPAMLLMMWAQYRVRSTYAAASQVPAALSGAAAARYILDESGCQDVGIEETHGTLSDHYDPSHRVLRLSSDVYYSRSAAAVGIAAHEAGHAIQHATHYSPLVVRNAAVPAAQAGPVASMVLLGLGVLFSSPKLIMLGILAYGALLVFQLVNLPVEFDASFRAKRLIRELNLVDGQGAAAVGSVLNAAAWTYVAATLQTLLTVLYYLMRFGGLSRDD
ncbi:MAG: zinc metallopeptidase [Planctomycetaceae bacterium]